MTRERIPFGMTDGSNVEPTVLPGESGRADRRTREFGGARFRMIQYTPGFCADHRCSEGHILLRLEGHLDTERADGRRYPLAAGRSERVPDGAEPHRAGSAGGVALFIVDRHRPIPARRPRTPDASEPRRPLVPTAGPSA